MLYWQRNWRVSIQRLPAILLAAGDCPLQNLNYEMHEVPNMEFMHGMCNIVVCIAIFGKFTRARKFHSNFVWRPQKAKSGWWQTICGTVFMQSLFDKSVVSRETLWLVQVIVEIIKIGYSHSSNRFVKSVLRFHNLSFLYGMYLRLAVCNALAQSPCPTGKCSEFITITTFHATMIFRVVSILSLIAELDESKIWQLRQISSATSSGRPMEISENCLMRATFLNVKENSKNQQWPHCRTRGETCETSWELLHPQELDGIFIYINVIYWLH